MIVKRTTGAGFCYINLAHVSLIVPAIDSDRVNVYFKGSDEKFETGVDILPVYENYARKCDVGFVQIEGRARMGA